MSRIRLVPVIFIALISLAILFGGWWAYRQFNIVTPLKTSLESVSGVKNVELDGGSSGVIRVTLGPVSDFQETYSSITQTVHEVLGSSGSVTVKIEDKRNQDLTNAYENLQPIIADGIAQGDYTKMFSRVVDKAKEMNVNAKITMNVEDHNLYIQLMKGNNYAYYVIPNPLVRGGGAS